MRNMYRWICWPAVLPEPFACGMRGFSAPTPLWETLKMHYQKLYPEGTTLPTSDFWLQARPLPPNTTKFRNMRPEPFAQGLGAIVRPVATTRPVR